MIKLYGAPISNYYNMVKVALIEKGIDCEGGALTSSNAKPLNRPQFSRHSTAAFRTALHTLPAIAGY